MTQIYTNKRHSFVQIKFLSHSEEETINFGVRLARNLRPSDIICLFGELGSGKTRLTKGVAEGLGFKKNEIISPSFVFIKEYRKGKFCLYHFDLYRLKNLKELFGLGYQEYLYSDAITVIEWADKMKGILPKDYLGIKFTIKGENERLIRLLPYGERYKKIIKDLYYKK